MYNVTGGVFFSSSFMHLLPDSMSNLKEAMPTSTGFEWACFFTTLGNDSFFETLYFKVYVLAFD